MDFTSLKGKHAYKNTDVEDRIIVPWQMENLVRKRRSKTMFSLFYYLSGIILKVGVDRQGDLVAISGIATILGACRTAFPGQTLR